MSKETPSYVTKAKRIAWQPYVDAQIRRQVHKGTPLENAIERALDLRDEHIKKGDAPPKRGRK